MKAEESLATIRMQMRHTVKNPKTAWRYMRLLEVVVPGSAGEGMVTAGSEAQYAYRDFNELPLSDQTTSWETFGNQPLL